MHYSQTPLEEMGYLYRTPNLLFFSMLGYIVAQVGFTTPITTSVAWLGLLLSFITGCTAIRQMMTSISERGKGIAKYSLLSGVTLILAAVIFLAPPFGG